LNGHTITQYFLIEINKDISMNLKNKKILIPGGSGMIGRELVNLLVEKGCNNITVASLDQNVELPPGVNFTRIDLRDFENCMSVCKNMDIVFSLIGIKGSPKMMQERPADFMVPGLQFNTNLMEAAMRSNVEWYLYTSSVGVYETHNVEVLKEDDVWKTFVSKNDWHGGWAKRMGELQADAYAIQYNRKNISIVRPGNVYGRYDNFDSDNAMVIPSLISKAINSDDGAFSVWGDGRTERDFIHARDVARGMIYVVENEVTEPINLGSGTAISIKQIAEIISDETNKKIVWDTTKPTGDSRRLLDMSRAKSHGFQCQISIKEGIQDVIEWYNENKNQTTTRYNSFKEEK
tara:strand:- start:4949 stop:5992 length:1044 start_codon:yes stop_codon:yes gene_type:complete